jgi:hypothetical protein
MLIGKESKQNAWVRNFKSDSFWGLSAEISNNGFDAKIGCARKNVASYVVLFMKYALVIQNMCQNILIQEILFLCAS